MVGCANFGLSRHGEAGALAERPRRLYTAGVVELVPPVCIDALLAAFEAMELDRERLRTSASIEASTSARLVPAWKWRALWEAVRAEVDRAELPTEAGLAVPLGAFGTIDYLAGSAETLAGAVQSMRDHLTSMSSGLLVHLDVQRLARLEIQVPAGGAEELEEFVLAAIVGRFKDRSGGRFVPHAVELTRAAPAFPSRHEALYGAPVAFGAAAATVSFDASALSAPLRTADPRLHETLRLLASRLSLGEGAHTSDLELAIRGRLRDLMRGRDVSAAAVARSLGMSERTLHRRLAELGRRYQDVVDACREAEAERLLLGSAESMLDVALSLGFSDQSAFNRAFRRWKKVPPTKWRAERLAATQS